MDKKRIVKDYEALPEEIVNRVKLEYPAGFADNLISYTNKEGKKVSALPFETEDIYYLIRMTIREAEQIIADDDDYDNDGNLKDGFVDEMAENASDDSEDDDDDDGITLKPKKKQDGGDDGFDEDFDF